MLPLLGVVTLDHAHTAQGLGETSADLSVDLAALAKDRTNRLERLPQCQRRDRDADEGDRRHGHADAYQNDEGENRG